MFSPEQYRALREGAGLVDRSDRGKLRLRGRDRRDYLQGLLTNDIAALTAGTGAYAALLTAQGRMISDMYVVETGDSVLLDVEPDVVDRVRDLLEQFVFSEDVQVSDETACLSQIGVLGPAASSIVARVLNARPVDSLEILQNRIERWHDSAVLIVRRDDLGAPGFELTIDRARAESLKTALQDAGAIPVDPSTTEITRIEAGRPRFHRDMTADTIPLEAGIEERAISLTKGCYVGQEIIIRVLHRGHGRVARRLVGFTFDPSAPVPSAADRVRAGDRDIGALTSAVWSPALKRPIAMGYVHREFAEPSTVVDVVSGEVVLPATVSSMPFVPQAPASGSRSARRQRVETPDR